MFSDLYEGTRMARMTDLSGIREIIQPLEASGALVRRTDKEVCDSALSYICSVITLFVLRINIVIIVYQQIFFILTSLVIGVNSYLKHWILSLLWKEKARSLLVLLFFLSWRRNVERLLLLQFLPIAEDKGREINYLV